MNCLAETDYRWGVSQSFSLLSTQRSLTDEQRLRLKKDGRPCPKVFVKGAVSESVFFSRFSCCIHIFVFKSNVIPNHILPILGFQDTTLPSSIKLKSRL